MRIQTWYLLSLSLQFSMVTDECLLLCSMVGAVEAALKSMIYILWVAFPLLISDIVIPCLNSDSSSQ